MHAAAARERRAYCASAPETELFSPSYFLLHGTIQLSTYSVTGWLLSVFTVRVPQAALTVRGTPIPSQRESESVTGRAALLPLYLRCESLGLTVLSAPVCVCTVRGTPIPSQRESESVTGWAALRLLPLYLRCESHGLRSAPVCVCAVRGTPIPSQRESCWAAQQRTKDAAAAHERRARACVRSSARAVSRMPR